MNRAGLRCPNFLVGQTVSLSVNLCGQKVKHRINNISHEINNAVATNRSQLSFPAKQPHTESGQYLSNIKVFYYKTDL